MDRKELYYYYKSKGICVVCGREQAFGRYVRCIDCIEKQQKAETLAHIRKRHKAAYKEHKKQGLCVTCSKPVTKGVRCEECKAKARAEANARNRRKTIGGKYVY